MPLVSVIIPVHNRERLLPRAIASVVAQTVQDFEIVIIDDASSDATEAVARSFQTDARVRYVKLPANVGGGEARNTGVRLALGRYVAFLDSDDEWTASKLERQIAALEARPRTGLVLCYTQVLIDDGQRPWLRPYRGIRSGEHYWEYHFCNRGLMQTSSIMVPIETARAISFPPSRRGADYDYCSLVALAGGEFVFLREALTIWHADRRADRLSHGWTHPELEMWLAGAKLPFSPKARRCYLATQGAVVLAREGRWRPLGRAWLHFLAAAWRLNLTRPALLHMVRRHLLPATWRLATAAAPAAKET